MIYLRKGNTDKAIEHFSNELQIRPDRAKVYITVGSLLLQQGKAVKAEEIYRRGLTFRPNNRALRYNLALLLAKQSRFDEAIEDTQAGLKSDPNSARLLGLLVLQRNMTKNKPDNFLSPIKSKKSKNKFPVTQFFFLSIPVHVY